MAIAPRGGIAMVAQRNLGERNETRPKARRIVRRHTAVCRLGQGVILPTRVLDSYPSAMTTSWGLAG